MAGSVILTRDLSWPVNSSQYNWVLEFLLNSATSVGLTELLVETLENNLPMLSVADMEPDDRLTVLRLLRDHLVSDATERLPSSMANRAGYVHALEELAALARRVLAERG
ncbi:MAG: hypothetical protein GEV10_25590 [Streptosporangiales bacterium]|nr:hypothetical protein [Streptosporangiales bacterium]